MSFLGIDLGTSGLRALLVDDAGQPIGSTERHYEVAHPHPGWSEQDPANWIAGAEAADQVPYLPALRSFRTVQPRRAVRAGLLAALVGCAGFAVALAPAEGPFGESAEAFFSCSSSRPFDT